jgi:hypothetical protein
MHSFHTTTLLMLFCIQSLTAQSLATLIPTNTSGTDVFWKELQQLCGYAFHGSVTFAAATDTTFRDKTLTMHVRACSKDIIRIPFFVGEDASRTWVLTRKDNRILLKHDHRHRDGTEDDLTQYGGWSTHSGADTIQIFPVDQFTIELLPATVANIWWIELVPGSHFTYNLRRVNTDRRFSVRFDLTKPVAAPEAPWGWKD